MENLKTLSNYSKILLGQNDGQNIYLSPPSWDCDWYWGFGYLGNNNCHYHVDGLKKIETYDYDKKSFSYEFVDFRDGFKKHFGNSFIVKREKDIWTLAELFKTFYQLNQTAELFYTGGSGMTSNPCHDLLKNSDEWKRINGILLPQIFEEIYKILHRNADGEKIFKKLVSINLKGDTMKVVEFMKENQISTDDLKNIDGLTKDDCSNIHSYFWADFHKNKETV